MNELPADDGVRMDVATSVLQYAAKQGVNLAQLLDMVERSAKVSHPLGNRRFHSWVFLVEKNLVKRMNPLPIGAVSSTIQRQNPKPGPGEFLAYDECEDCDGHGCNQCDGRGDVPVIRRIPKASR